MARSHSGSTCPRHLLQGLVPWKKSRSAQHSPRTQLVQQEQHATRGTRGIEWLKLPPNVHQRQQRPESREIPPLSKRLSNVFDHLFDAFKSQIKVNIPFSPYVKEGSLIDFTAKENRSQKLSRGKNRCHGNESSRLVRTCHVSLHISLMLAKISEWTIRNLEYSITLGDHGV